MKAFDRTKYLRRIRALRADVRSYQTLSELNAEQWKMVMAQRDEARQALSILSRENLVSVDSLVDIDNQDAITVISAMKSARGEA